MAINIKENPIATAISQGISSIPSYIQQGQQMQTNQLNNQINMLNAVMAANTYNQEQKAYRKSQYMDALGYDNVAINELIQGWQYPTGKFEKDIDNPSGWKWTDENMDNVLPTKAEAWEQYKKALGGYSNQQDHAYFYEKLWPQIVASRNQSYQQEIANLTNLGVSQNDIRWIMANNPVFDKGLSNLQNSLAPEQQAAFKPFLAQEDKSFAQRWQDNSLILGGGALGTGVLYNQAMKFDPEVVEKVQKEFKTAEGEWKAKIDKHKADIAKAEKTKAKTDKSKKSKATRIKNLKKQLANTRGAKSRALKALDKTGMETLKDSRLWNRWGLGTNPLIRMGAAQASPFLLRNIGEMLGGDRGAAIGQGAGAGLELAASGASLMSLEKRLAEMALKNTAKRASKASVMAAADLGLPFGDALGAAYMLYGGASDALQAYRMWQEDKARRKNK
tara:strand:+ start:1122 stop:2462 length:1341 start_codon:yes stop_codon:yes gene_type:complete